MILKKLADHLVHKTPTCGIVHGILTRADFEGVNVAMAFDIQATLSHFHRTFDEIYFVIDGELELKFHDPAENRTWTETLAANELCLITRGTHHAVVKATLENRLAVITVPHFDPADETPSEIL